MYMALHIQDPETDKLARELSAVTGETITQAVNIALRDRLRSVAPARAEAEYIARIEAIAARLGAMPPRRNARLVVSDAGCGRWRGGSRAHLRAFSGLTLSVCCSTWAGVPVEPLIRSRRVSALARDNLSAPPPAH